MNLNQVIGVGIYILYGFRFYQKRKFKYRYIKYMYREVVMGDMGLRLFIRKKILEDIKFVGILYLDIYIQNCEY